MSTYLNELIKSVEREAEAERKRVQLFEKARSSQRQSRDEIETSHTLNRALQRLEVLEGLRKRERRHPVPKTPAVTDAGKAERRAR